jgi:DNA-binding transcriptional ArsR family regulator
MMNRGQPAGGGLPIARDPTSLHRPKKGQMFSDWLSAAARLPGKSFHVAVALREAAERNQSGVVSLSNTAVQHLGLDRSAKYRALAWLEQAGLIAVKRKLGRPPIITLLDPDVRR